MGNIKAGVIVKNRFCKPSSSKYNQYINYMDRPEAVRTEHTMEYDLYADYMGNPEKTTGLFTAEKNRLTEAESKEMKKRFAAAQEKGSLMWQTVISFDNSWLKENGLLHDGILDEKKIYEVTRKGMRKMLQKEGLENAIWSGSIHYNTDNIHIHVATVEPDPMRKVKEYQEYEWKEENGKKVKAPVRNKNGKLVSSQEMVGRFKLSSIEACKSTIANEIIKSRDINHKINEIIRGTIIKQKKDHSLAEDKELAHAFFQLYKKLPECDKKMWNYSTNLMKSIRPDIDELSRRYIDQYHKNDFQKLVSELKMQSLKYQEAYSTKGNPEEYVNNKIKDLYKKLGNCILKELREYDNYAMYQLAKINLENGDIESLKESEKLLMKAAERFDYAQYALGDIYTDKESPLYQMEKGIKWLEKARNNGNEYASYKLGKIYSDMHSEYYDLHKSIGYLEGSTENNYVKELLGKCYLKLPEKEQQRKGVDILRDAMEKGASESTQYVLGKYLAYQGEQKSEIKEGMQMLTELAENNYEYAQVSLGIFYMKKEPGEQNFELSKYWLGKAKDQGNAFAEEILKNVEMRTAMYAGKKRSSVRLEYIRYGSALNKAIVSLKRSMNNEYEQRQNEWEHELLTRLPEKEQEYER